MQSARRSAVTDPATRGFSRRVTLSPRATAISPTAHNSPTGDNSNEGDCMVADAGAAVGRDTTRIINCVEVLLPAARFTEAGLNVQEIALVTPSQPKLTWPLNPFTEAMAKSKVAPPPTGMVALKEEGGVTARSTT